MPYVTVYMNPDTEWNGHTATNFIHAFMEKYSYSLKTEYPKKGVFLEIWAHYSFGIFWKIFILHEDDIKKTAQLIRTYYPDVRLTSDGYYIPSNYPLYVKSALLYRTKNIELKTPAYVDATDIKARNDPLILLTHAMNTLQENECMVYRIHVADYMQVSSRGWFDVLTDLVKITDAYSGKSTYINPDQEQLRQMIQEREKNKLIVTRIAVQIYTPHQNRFDILQTALTTIKPLSGWGAFDTYFTFKHDKINNVDDWEGSFSYNLGDSLKKEDWTQTAFLLTASELASLWHFPHKEMTASKILWHEPEPETCIPEELHNIEGIHIGKSCEIDVHLPIDDRTTHTMIIGRNGTGKSSLMHRMIHEDIASGRGLCVIDPQGNLIPQILRSSIPDNRLDDVVILDPSMEVDGVKYPPPINPLFKADGDVSLTILGMIQRVYGEFSGTRMEYLLQMALRMLSEEAHPTLMSVRKIFSDPKYARRLVNEADSINLETQWADFSDKSVKNQADMTFPMFTRLDRFYDSNQALAVTCHPDTLNLHELVRNNKIILVNLGSKGNKLDESVRTIIGSTIVTQIEAIAKSGAITSPPYLLYIDEAQNFVDTPIDRMLAEVRQHGLGLILANQFLHQFTGEVQDAIEGNVGTMFSFEIGRGDARAMKHYMTTFEADDLTSLGKFKSAVSMRYNNNRQPSFLLETMPPPGSDLDEVQALERENQVRARSVENYTPKSYDEVITWVREQYVANNNQQPDTDEQDDDHTEENPNQPKDDEQGKDNEQNDDDEQA